MNRASLVSALEAVVGKEYVFHHPDDLLVYESDASVDRHTPGIVVVPASSEEVARVVHLAFELGLLLVPRGAGTGLSGGAVALGENTIQVALTRMHRVLEVDTVNQMAVVEPGLVNLDLTTAVSRYGLYYAPDPSSQRACTIGGNVAENAGGPHCLRYGTTTNHVLGVEVVLEDGSVVWLGGHSRDLPGYDLTGAFVGGEGTLGIATRVVVRLLPAPEAIRTFLAIFDRMEDASAAVSGIIAAGIVPAALEMMDNLAIRAVENARPVGYPTDAEAVLLVEVDGLREEVEGEGEEVGRVCQSLGARQLRFADDPKERELLWAGRKGALGALGTIAPNYYLLDGVVPRTRLLEVLQRVKEVERQHGFPIANVFHAGDGNLHPCVLFDERKGEAHRAIEAAGAILKACVEAGGVLTGEHGVGIEKRAFMPLMFTPQDLAAMERLRDAFAPGHRFNPGKVFPEGATCGEPQPTPTSSGLPADAWV
ncbi:MAG: FAD-binding protein [Chloroflexi bacterium]|nr:FAD-binding protein [Chloroflexota bacterium]